MLRSKVVINCMTKRCLSSGINKFPLIQFTKIVHPGDTQMLGHVQGGLMLKLIETSAAIAAKKCCFKYGIKNVNGEIPHPALLGVERLDMLATGEIGSIMEFIARVIRVEEKSLRIYVDVYSSTCENRRQLLNKGLLWYKPVDIRDGHTGQLIIPQHLQDENDLSYDNYFNLSLQMYLDNIKDSTNQETIQHINNIAREKLQHDVMNTTTYSIMPYHCNILNQCEEGEILRWMDEFAGASVGKYTGIFVVTGSMDNCVISQPVPPGSCISFVSRFVHSGRRTVDIQVIGSMENNDNIEPQVFISSFFTFVIPRKQIDDNFVLPLIQIDTEELHLLHKSRELLHKTRKELFSKFKDK